MGSEEETPSHERQPGTSGAILRTPILVVSREHQLLPLAHRLRNVEGWPTEVVVWKRSYENAWQGMIEKDLLSSKREIGEKSITEWKERVDAGELVVVHDVPKLATAFASDFMFSLGVKSTITPPSVRLGFWWNGIEPQLPHLLVYDMGAWPGGKGRETPGGLTLIRVSDDNLALWHELFNHEEATYWLKDFRGLVNIGLREEKGKLVAVNYKAGWPALHTQVFMGAVKGSWGELLTEGKLPEFTHKYAVGLPVSVPPWPGSSNIKSQARGVKDLPIDLNPKLHEYVYWHDVNINVEEKSLSTAGLDGLVGVVHSESDSFENALQKCLGIAELVGVNEKQYRSDIGGGVRMLESQLNEHYKISF